MYCFILLHSTLSNLQSFFILVIKLCNSNKTIMCLAKTNVLISEECVASFKLLLFCLKSMVINLSFIQRVQEPIFVSCDCLFTVSTQCFLTLFFLYMLMNHNVNYRVQGSVLFLYVHMLSLILYRSPTSNHQPTAPSFIINTLGPSYKELWHHFQIFCRFMMSH